MADSTLPHASAQRFADADPASALVERLLAPAATPGESLDPAAEAAAQALIAALGAREGATAEHSHAVVALTRRVALRMGLSGPAVVAAEQVALLHDIGKVGVPDAILHKPGRLTEPEWELMRRHPVVGEEIVASIGPLAHLASVVRAEHEHWEGGGYPDGLAGEAIPLASRICLACDAYDAMTSDRPYRRALGDAAARAELRRQAGIQFCPVTVAVLLEVLDAEPAEADAPRARPVSPPPAFAQAAGGSEAELRALIRVSTAVAAAHGLEEVLEVVAEESCQVLGAASVSISRWEPEANRLRTLINVGDLGPGEERWPEAELWPLEDFPEVTAGLESGEASIVDLRDPTLPAAERRVLEDLAKGSCLRMPICRDGRAWGKLEAFSALGSTAFSPADAPFVEALCNQVALAIGRAELFTSLNTLAYQDPLTGLANRRALEEGLETAVARAAAAGEQLSLLFCDLDRLKELNDSEGHEAGDAALKDVAKALTLAAAAYPRSSISRIGGDEFCVLLEGHDSAAAQALAEDAERRLARRGGRLLTVSCGAASLQHAGQRPADLFRAADAAQYVAKRSGRGRVYVAEAGVDSASGRREADIELPGRRRGRRDAVDAPGDLVSAALWVLEGSLAGAAVADRLEGLSITFAETFDAGGWAVSWRPPGGDAVNTLFEGGRRAHRVSGVPSLRFRAADDAYLAADYPTTAAILDGGGGFCVRADDPEGDPAEQALLARAGYRGVIAAAAVAGPAAWLVEVFADERTGALEESLGELRLLTAEAVRGAR